MPRPTQALDASPSVSPYGTLTLSGQAVQTCSGNQSVFTCCLAAVEAYNPNGLTVGLGSSAFARHYLRNTLCSSGYLDVSVLLVPFLSSIDSTRGSCEYPEEQRVFSLTE